MQQSIELTNINQLSSYYQIYHNNCLILFSSLDCEKYSSTSVDCNSAPRSWNGLPKVVHDCFTEANSPVSTETLTNY